MHPRSRWFYPLLIGIGVLGLAVIVVAQGAHNLRTDIFDFANGFMLNGGTVITGTTGAQDSAVNLPKNSVGGGEVSGLFMNAIFCGQEAAGGAGGTVYLGPALSAFAGAPDDTTIGGTVCDALESADEATADGPLFANVALKATSMYCRGDGTLGAGETVTFTLRSAAADTTPVISCAITAGQTDCRSLTGTTSNVAAGGTMAVKAVSVGNNTDNYRCVVGVALQ
jgi:hypothetical protein